MTREDNFIQFAEILNKHAATAIRERKELAAECAETVLSKAHSVSEAITRLYGHILDDLKAESLIIDEDEEV